MTETVKAIILYVTFVVGGCSLAWIAVCTQDFFDKLSTKMVDLHARIRQLDKFIRANSYRSNRAQEVSSSEALRREQSFTGTQAAILQAPVPSFNARATGSSTPSVPYPAELENLYTQALRRYFDARVYPGNEPSYSEDRAYPPAQGSLVGSAYEYVDGSVLPSSTYSTYQSSLAGSQLGGIVTNSQPMSNLRNNTSPFVGVEDIPSERPY